MRRTSGNLIIAGQVFPTDAPIINFREPPYWDSTREYCIPTELYPNPPCKPGGVPYSPKLLHPYTKRYSTRGPLRKFGMNPPLDAVKAVIRQFVIHHDGCTSADMCFNVLQNERGLSCHFLVDNDGTIYQTIDLAFMAYHAAEWNTNSIGVELCSRGDAQRDGVHFYDSGKYGPKRDVTKVKINGHTILTYQFTDQQFDAMVRLGRALQRLLPNIPSEFPQASPGQPLMDTMPASQSFRFAGYIAHYHLTTQKWDPGPWDFKKFTSKLRGQLSLPIYVKEPDDKNAGAPKVPEKTDDLKTAAVDLYKANEQRADGGFFPVGPWGEARLWHGGVHLTGKADAGVYAPFPGRLVAARMGGSSQVGSTNFVLLRHDMTLGTARVVFFSLYMHLAQESQADKPAEWTTKSDAWKNAKVGEVALLDEPIEAGSLIGHVGTAGPAELSRAQVHVELFSTYELFTEIKGAPWQVVDGTSGGRFCDSQQINDIIDSDKDGTLSRPELTAFYSGGSVEQTHYLVTLHVSEWTSEPSWSDALRVPKDFRKFKPAEIDALVQEQITPGLWWDANVAAHCKLPADGVVFHYHPVSFLYWFNQQLLDAAASAPVGAPAGDATGVPKGVTDDGDQAGDGEMRSDAEDKEDPCNQKITLEHMVMGFDAPECGP
jgi:hypothetical protein